MTDWVEILYRELDEWNYAGTAATLWWRDDDVQSPSAELDRLTDLAQKYAIPLALAVIPQGMQSALAVHLNSLPTVTVLQHGFCHANHAPSGEKKAELGDHRAVSAMHDELVSGFAMLKRDFAEQFIAVLVPPWNRITPKLMDGLTPSGLVGLSQFGARSVRQPVCGVGVVNTHVDIIDWKQHKRFVGAQLAVQAMVAHLRGRRLGQFDHAEPTGLLTHHLVHDADCWRFLARLVAVLDEHPAVQWRSAKVAFNAARY